MSQKHPFAHEVFPSISLDAILSKENEALSTLKTELATKGWAVITLTSKLHELATSLSQPLVDFFNLTEGKFSWSAGRVYGYSETPHKETLRYLTGPNLSTNKIPAQFRDSFLELGQQFDLVLNQLTQSTCETLFDCEPEALLDHYDFPALRKSPDRFNLIDAAFYKNNIVDKKTIKEETLPPDNCVSHYDPGLFSLSILSTSHGLQMHDPTTDTWYNSPLQDTPLGLIWCGDAASKISQGKLKAAVHKVVYPEEPGIQRLSLWAELCTIEQVFSGNQNVTYDPRVKKILVSNLLNKSYTVPVVDGNILEALTLAERLIGMPLSKIMLLPLFNSDGDVIGFN